MAHPQDIAQVRRPIIHVIATPSRRGKDGALPKIEALHAMGIVEYLLRPQDPIPVEAPEETLALLVERLEHFEPTQDSLVWIGGDTLAAVLVGVALERLGFNSVFWLRYDRRRDGNGGWTHEGAKYTPVECEFWRDENDGDYRTDLHRS